MLVTFLLELLVVISQSLHFQIDLDLNPDLFSTNHVLKWTLYPIQLIGIIGLIKTVPFHRMLYPIVF